MQTRVAQQNRGLVPEIIERLEAGEVIILPTATVYALVFKADLPDAIARVAELKRGSSPQPYAIFTRKEYASKYVEVDANGQTLIEQFPYPITLIVRAKEAVPEGVANGFRNIFAVCPDRFIYDLIETVPFLMACTSASLFGGIKAATAEQALKFFEGQVPFVVDGGNSQYGRSGTLIDTTVERPAILTFGPVSFDDLRSTIPEIELPSHMRK